MEATISVYNPDDEELEFRFDGREYRLAPEDITQIPRPALGVMLSQVGEFGVTPVPNGTPREEFEKLVSDARKRWVEGVRTWAERILISSAKSNKERTDIGLAPVEGPEVVQAREWLRKQGFLK